ncbi:hypothetical protein J6590_060075 [Homalodisca vitripennis]|nr:hypothetical protein J6590_060075 [Homalodisca vitripennis]
MPGLPTPKSVQHRPLTAATISSLWKKEPRCGAAINFHLTTVSCAVPGRPADRLLQLWPHSIRCTCSPSRFDK